MAKTKIVNVVATASTDQTIDFEELGKLGGIRHDSEIYGGRVAYFKKATMRGRVSIFSSGKIISVGTKSETEAFNELKDAISFLVTNRLIKNVKISPIVRNIVVTADFEKKINLEMLAENPRAIYEPEQFPAIILRLEKPFRVSILVFASGKTVLTGLTSATEIEPMISELGHFLGLNQK